MSLSVSLSISEQTPCKRWAVSGRVTDSDGGGVSFAQVSVSGVLTGDTRADVDGYFRMILDAPETGDFVVTAVLGPFDQGDTSDSVSNGNPTCYIGAQITDDRSDDEIYAGTVRVSGGIYDETPQCCVGDFGITGGGRQGITSDPNGGSEFSADFEVSGSFGGASEKTVQCDVQITDPYGRTAQNWCSVTFTRRADPNHGGNP